MQQTEQKPFALWYPRVPGHTATERERFATRTEARQEGLRIRGDRPDLRRQDVWIEVGGKMVERVGA